MVHTPSVTGSTGTKNEQNQIQMPKDAQIIALLLKSVGIDSCEPGVIPQLLEFLYRYSTEVLQDAQIIADHAEREDIEAKDVRLAIAQKVNHTFTPPPTRQLLLDLAATRNAQPLPVINEKQGIRLPPERHCLLSLNYQVLPKKAEPSKINQTAPTRALNPPSALQHISQPAPVPMNVVQAINFAEEDDYEDDEGDMDVDD
ncbi:TFIID-31kDa-domain-containing protein [Rozella allomycis CSF55]|uniref:Histone-fold domain-containing protein n=1 Tax=Rozella allomycis (strain CSF55) TaxID=988480 RepID=A0A075AZ70_ROZAC|nr:Histone-fold domain-containing protein [Rozella allomycis CSF55]RKP18694.1 TFIID-31kDa-domain-containing protein [Rozella allomycis CSF55]|eukprot:EPZ35562.1 Histone-fold domain-containing protein [Rozella allomycis CSF55]